MDIMAPSVAIAHITVDISQVSGDSYRDRLGRPVRLSKDSGEKYSGFKGYIHTPWERGQRISQVTYRWAPQTGLPAQLDGCHQVTVYYLDYDYSNKIPLMMVIMAADGMATYANRGTRWSTIPQAISSTREVREHLLRIAREIGFPIILDIKAMSNYSRAGGPEISVVKTTVYSVFVKYIHVVPGGKMRVLSTIYGQHEWHTKDAFMYRCMHSSATLYYWIGSGTPLFLKLVGDESRFYKFHDKHWIPIPKSPNFYDFLDQRNLELNKVIPLDIFPNSTCAYMRDSYVAKEWQNGGHYGESSGHYGESSDHYGESSGHYGESSDHSGRSVAMAPVGRHYDHQSPSIHATIHPPLGRMAILHYRAQKEYKFSRIKNGEVTQVGFESAFKGVVNEAFSFIVQGKDTPSIMYLLGSEPLWFLLVRGNTWRRVSRDPPANERDTQRILQLLTEWNDGPYNDHNGQNDDPFSRTHYGQDDDPFSRTHYGQDEPTKGGRNGPNGVRKNGQMNGHSAHYDENSEMDHHSFKKALWLILLEAFLDISWKVVVGVICYRRFKRRSWSFNRTL